MNIPLSKSWHLIKLSNEEFFFYNQEKGVSEWTVPKEVRNLIEQNHEWIAKISGDAQNDSSKVHSTYAMHPSPSQEFASNNVNWPNSHSSDHAPQTMHESPHLNAEKKLSPQEKFEELLKESQLTKFSVWSAIEPKLKKDARFHGLKPKERKVIFMKYIREVLKK